MATHADWASWSTLATQSSPAGWTYVWGGLVGRVGLLQGAGLGHMHAPLSGVGQMANTHAGWCAHMGFPLHASVHTPSVRGAFPHVHTVLPKATWAGLMPLALIFLCRGPLWSYGFEVILGWARSEFFRSILRAH